MRGRERESDCKLGVVAVGRAIEMEVGQGGAIQLTRAIEMEGCKTARDLLAAEAVAREQHRRQRWLLRAAISTHPRPAAAGER